MSKLRAVLAAALLSLSAQAQSPVARYEKGINGAFAQSTCEYELLINAGDAAGTRVTDLNANDFVARFGKQPLPIVSLENVHVMPRVVILIDVSGSMQKHGLTPAISMTMASAVFSLIEKDAPVAVGIFADRLTMITEFGTDRNAAADAIRANMPKKNRWSGPTRALEVAADALGIFGDVRPGDSIVLISDGGDNRSWKVDDAMAKLQKSGVRIFLAGPDPRHFSDENEIHLMQAIYASGGRSFLWRRTNRLGDRDSDPLTQKEVSEILSEARNLAARIHYVYRLRLQVPAKINELKLELDPRRRKEFRSVGLEYPSKLSPCTRTAEPAMEAQKP